MRNAPVTRLIRRSAFILAVVRCAAWVITEFSAIAQLRANRPPECSTTIPHVDWTITLWTALAGYLLGGGIALLRTKDEIEHVEQSRSGGKDNVLGTKWLSPKFLGYLVLWFFLANLVILLAYETYAVATVGVWPITSFVRCANATTDNRTVLALGVGALTFLLGHWFWYPLRWWEHQDKQAPPRLVPVALAVLGLLAGLALAVVIARNSEGGFRETLVRVILAWIGVSALAEFYTWIQPKPDAVARLHAWSGQYPIFAAGIAALVGLLIGHFF